MPELQLERDAQGKEHRQQQRGIPAAKPAGEEATDDRKDDQPERADVDEGLTRDLSRSQLDRRDADEQPPRHLPTPVSPFGS